MAYGVKNIRFMFTFFKYFCELKLTLPPLSKRSSEPFLKLSVHKIIYSNNTNGLLIK